FATEFPRSKTCIGFLANCQASRPSTLYKASPGLRKSCRHRLNFPKPLFAKLTMKSGICASPFLAKNVPGRAASKTSSPRQSRCFDLGKDAQRVSRARLGQAVACAQRERGKSASSTTHLDPFAD